MAEPLIATLQGLSVRKVGEPNEYQSKRHGGAWVHRTEVGTEDAEGNRITLVFDHKRQDLPVRGDTIDATVRLTFYAPKQYDVVVTSTVLDWGHTETGEIADLPNLPN